MGLFDTLKTNTTQPTPVVSEQPVQATIAPTHISKKKKNTYTVTFNVLAQLNLFSMCRNTPLPVITLNGKQQNTGMDWLSSKDFPNPCASDMAQKHKVLSEILGSKLSCQIIEYLDKETGKPVVQIYPESMYVFDEYNDNYMQRLNHASRQDMQHQISLRVKLINDFIEKNKLQQR